MTPQRLVLLATAIMLTVYATAQSTDSTTQRVSSKYLDKISAESKRVEQNLNRKSQKALLQMQKQEAAIKRKLERTDSAKAIAIFGDLAQQYNRFQQRLQKTGSSRQYIGLLDTVTTSLKFLEKNPQFLSAAKGTQQKLINATTNVKALEGQFQKAEEIKAFLKERKQYLKTQLSKLGYARQLKRLNKQAYYYSQQIVEYKNIIAEPKKAEQKAIEYLAKTKLFTDFMKKNGMLAGIFPGSGVGQSTPGATQAGFAALQTRAQVTSYIQQTVLRMPNSMDGFQRNIQNAQSQVNDLRSRLSRLTGSSGGDLEMPDFKPNTQRTKSFFKRLDYGVSFQSQQGNGFFPVTSDIGLTVGYKLNDKSVVGIGAGYKLGFGTGWKNISLSNQGASLKSFIDWKIRDGFWLSGGYEKNYRTMLNGATIASALSGIRKADPWQESGLIGVTKTIPLKSQFFKKTKFQLLWDFLSYRQVPRNRALLFRIGYGF